MVMSFEVKGALNLISIRHDIPPERRIAGQRRRRHSVPVMAAVDVTPTRPAVLRSAGLLLKARFHRQSKGTRARCSKPPTRLLEFPDGDCPGTFDVNPTNKSTNKPTNKPTTRERWPETRIEAAWDDKVAGVGKGWRGNRLRAELGEKPADRTSKAFQSRVRDQQP